MKQGLVIIDLLGTQLSAEEKELIQHPRVGGIIFFARNYESPEQIKQLIDELRSANDSLLMTVDQEGGRVQRFREGFSTLASHAEIGEMYDKDPLKGLTLAYEVGYTMASELLEVGIDLCFAPVVDLDYGVSEVISDRSFHAEPNIVLKLAEQYIHGMQEAGMEAVIKHAPGHGYVAGDTHHESPIDKRSFDEIFSSDLYPFRALIKGGVMGVMFSHVIYESVDELPASLSSRWVDIFKRDLGFKGTIFTDALDMAAASQIGSLTERVKLAFSAGVDVPLLCNDRAGTIEVLGQL